MQESKSHPDQVRFTDLFKTSIATLRLTPPKKEHKGMSNYMQSLEQDLDNKENQQFGDKFGIGTIHQLPEFNWLTNEIEKAVMAYLKKCGIDDLEVAIFHQKSWPVITRRGSNIVRHSHPNSILSAVYYLQVSPDSGGNLIIVGGPDLIEGTIERRYLNSTPSTRCGIQPQNNSLIIFPSLLNHYVTPYKGKLTRWSITYDITITAGSNIGSGKSENSLIHPMYWREFRRGKKSPKTIPNNHMVEGDFFKDGYLANKSLIPQNQTGVILSKLIERMGANDNRLNHQDRFRFQTPIKLDDASASIIRRIMAFYYPKLKQFLREDSQFLTGLNSICSFPNAKEERFNSKASISQETTASIYLNLLSIEAESGPLIVIPGSHKKRERIIRKDSAIYSIFPVGSTILLNEDVLHCFSSNHSNSKISPFLVVTFGSKHNVRDSKILNNAYIGKYKLDDFI